MNVCKKIMYLFCIYVSIVSSSKLVWINHFSNTSTYKKDLKASVHLYYLLIQ